MAIALTLTAGAVIAGVPGAIFGVPLVAALNAAFKALQGEPPQEGGVTFDAHDPHDQPVQSKEPEAVPDEAKDALKDAERGF